MRFYFTNRASVTSCYSVQLLKQRDKNSSQEWLNKLPQMVKQLEVSLYRSAPSFEAYADKSTLKHRLQLLAMEIAKKTHLPGGDEHSTGGDNHRGSSSNKRPDAQQNRNVFPNLNGAPPSGRPSNAHHNHRGPINTPREHRGVISMEQPNSMPNSIPSTGMSWSRPRPRDLVQNSREESKPLVSLGRINDMIGNDLGTPAVPSISSNGPGSSSTSKTSEKEWEVRIRHKQQRLLLLHHSSKCQNTDGKCPVTQHCADMKRLWLHMAKCEDNRCTVAHCYSSRAILSHYRKCKDADCQACGPVRETVWKHRNNPGPSNGQIPFSSEYTPSSSQSPGGGIGRPEKEITRQPKPPPPPQSSIPPRGTAAPDPKIKHKQQRLLLLRHASKCEAKEGECRKTPHCAEMKKLWKHISQCHDKTCKYPHCLSSRYVLMHYRRCKDTRCPACAPVRETIRQSQESSGSKTPVNLEPEVMANKKPRIDYGGKTDAKIAESNIARVNPRPVPFPKPTPKKILVASPTTSSNPKESNNQDLTYSIINNFTIRQIELHLKSLNQTYLLPQKTMKEKCQIILNALKQHSNFWIFEKPVDTVELGLPDYFDIIKKPMDLGTAQKKLDSGQYHSIEDFNCDVRLTFDNALTYNEEGSAVNGMASAMKEVYVSKYEELLLSLKKEEEERKKNERACALCGFEKLQFEPPVFFCNNLKCHSTRIHRNRHFYVGGNNQYNYCSQCYNELDNEAPIKLPDLTLNKMDLKKKKNDEVHEENWVQCDICQRWIHQICGLFNSRQNADNGSTYSCPKCLLDERKKGKKPGKASAPTAEGLPRTSLSEWIETYIKPKVKAHYRVLAQEKSEVEVCNISLLYFLFDLNSILFTHSFIKSISCIHLFIDV